MASKRTQLARLAEDVAQELADVTDPDERALLRDAFDNGVDQELRWLDQVRDSLQHSQQVLVPARRVDVAALDRLEQGDAMLAATVGLRVIR